MHNYPKNSLSLSLQVSTLKLLTHMFDSLVRVSRPIARDVFLSFPVLSLSFLFPISFSSIGGKGHGQGEETEKAEKGSEHANTRTDGDTDSNERQTTQTQTHTPSPNFFAVGLKRLSSCE